MVAHLIEVVQIVGIAVALIPIIGLMVLITENALDTIECLSKKFQIIMKDMMKTKKWDAIRNIK